MRSPGIAFTPLSCKKSSADNSYLTPLSAANSDNDVKRRCNRKMEPTEENINIEDKLSAANPSPKGAMEPESAAQAIRIGVTSGSLPKTSRILFLYLPLPRISLGGSQEAGTSSTQEFSRE
jgi:hypothetical protein